MHSICRTCHALKNGICQNQKCRCTYFPKCTRNRINALTCEYHTCKKCEPLYGSPGSVYVNSDKLHMTEKYDPQYELLRSHQDIFCPQDTIILPCSSGENGYEKSLYCYTIYPKHKQYFTDCPKYSMCLKCISFNKCIGCSKLLLIKDSYKDPKLCMACGTVVQCYNKKCNNTWVNRKADLTGFDLCATCQNTYTVCPECQIAYPQNSYAMSPKIKIYATEVPHCVSCIATKNTLEIDDKGVDYHNTVKWRAMCIKWRALLPAYNLYIKRLQKRRPITPELVAPLVEYFVWFLRGNDDKQNTQYRALMNLMLPLPAKKIHQFLDQAPQNNLLSLVINIASLPRDPFWLILSWF